MVCHGDACAPNTLLYPDGRWSGHVDFGLLGIADRFGSIEAGKVADLVLYDGDPFEQATHVTHTLIDGRVIYDRGEYLKLPFARRALALTGGEVGCCMGVW